MNKAQAVAVLLTGAALGAGGKAVVGAIGPSVVDAAAAVPFTHAVDLRRDYASGADGGVRVTVYATETRADGGTKDIGQAVSCKPSATTLTEARSLMNVLAKECDWAR